MSENESEEADDGGEEVFVHRNLALVGDFFPGLRILLIYIGNLTVQVISNSAGNI